MLPSVEFTILQRLITLKTYDIFIFLSIVTGFLLSFKVLKQNGLSLKAILLIYTLITFSFLFGARALNYAIQYKTYSEIGISFFTFRLAYFSLYGGIICSFLVLLLIIKKLNLNSYDILDKLSPCFLISFFIMKIGCLLNGCCYGKLTDSWFSIPLPLREKARFSQNTFVSSLFGNISMRVYPAQLMEGIGALLIVGILFFFRRKLVKGETFLFSAMLFSLLRFVVLFYRQLPYSDFIKLWFYPMVYIFIIVYTSRMLIKTHMKKHIINES